MRSPRGRDYHKNKPVKRFHQMDVGMSSIQAYKAHKQEGTLASLHQWLYCMSNNQAIFSIFCNLELIATKLFFQFFCNLELICISYNYDAATDVGMLGKTVPIECPLFVHLAYQCSFLFVCFVGLYAGHPYIHLISFEIFLLACFYDNPYHVVNASE